MKKSHTNFRFLTAVLSSLLALAMHCKSVQAKSSSPENPTAELLISGAAIYTVDPVRTWADAVAIKDGKILCVGTEADCNRYIGPDTRRLCLKGGMVLPGFHDCHIHLAESGLELKQCTLADCETAESVYQTIEKYAQEHKDAPWIIGSGWQLPLFGETGPERLALDKLVPDRPAYFPSQDAHSAWVNSAALKLAKIDVGTKDPAHGRIERDASGEPSGTLRESAVELVDKLLPKRSDSERLEALKAAQKLANSFGITSIQDAHASEEILKTYCGLDDLKQLSVKVVAAMDVDPEQDATQIERLNQWRARYTRGKVRATSAKIFADGVIEAHTAALLKPYSDKPAQSGMLNFQPQALKEIVTALDRGQFQVHVHAIGDRAINEALDAFENARLVNGRRDSRHQIAHLELIKPEDIERFRDLRVLANFESFWAFRDPYIVKCTEPLLGPERSKHLYRIGSLLRSGAIVVGGSDWSVSSMNPLDAIQVAVTRKGLTDTTGDAWDADERAPLAEMIAAYTINGAYCNNQEKTTGSIEAGKAADLIVLDKNLFAISPSQLHESKVLLTLLDGADVYHSGELHYEPAGLALRAAAEVK